MQEINLPLDLYQDAYKPETQLGHYSPTRNLSSEPATTSNPCPPATLQHSDHFARQTFIPQWTVTFGGEKTFFTRRIPINDTEKRNRWEGPGTSTNPFWSAKTQSPQPILDKPPISCWSHDDVDTQGDQMDLQQPIHSNEVEEVVINKELNVTTTTVDQFTNHQAITDKSTVVCNDLFDSYEKDGYYLRRSHRVSLKPKTIDAEIAKNEELLVSQKPHRMQGQESKRKYQVKTNSPGRPDSNVSIVISIERGRKKIKNKSREQNRYDERNLENSPLDLKRNRAYNTSTDDNNDAVVKEQSKRQKNREASKLARQKRKEYVESLQEEYITLTEANNDLSTYIEKLKSENERLKCKLGAYDN